MEAYRDFDAVFERELLPRVELRTERRKEPVEFPEDYSQEFEGLNDRLALRRWGSSRPDSPSTLAAEEFNSKRKASPRMRAIN